MVRFWLILLALGLGAFLIRKPILDFLSKTPAQQNAGMTSFIIINIIAVLGIAIVIGLIIKGTKQTT